MAKGKTKPLKVTAKLIDGRINSADGIIMFDGVLYHAWFLKYHPEVFETGQWMEHGSGYVGLPLRQLPGNRWAASRGVYKQLAEKIEHWNKRPDFFAPDKIDFLDMDKGLISDSVGGYRAYRTPNVIRVIKDGIIDFYCMGHKDDILDLLSYIPAVGKKPSMGWGIVAEWTAEEIDEDYSLMHPECGLMRPTPVEEIELDGYPMMDYSVKPPYWKQGNKRRCYIPDAIGTRKTTVFDT